MMVSTDDGNGDEVLMSIAIEVLRVTVTMVSMMDGEHEGEGMDATPLPKISNRLGKC